MLHIAKQTRMEPAAIINRAAMFFGAGGEGLREAERGSCCISFEGVGGYVAVSVVDEEKHRMVDVQTREFEYQARQFLQKL